MEGKSLLRGSTLLLGLALLRTMVGVGQGGEILSSPKEDRLPEMLEEARGVRKGEEEAVALEVGETLDPNRADSVALLRLPGVGRKVAREIVAHREREGAYGKPEDLLAVSGIGPATLSRIGPFLDFSRGAPASLRDARRASREAPAALDLNRATSEELQALPGIGPALSLRIVEHRVREGPFRRAEDLLKVRGIGPRTLERIRSLIRVAR